MAQLLILCVCGRRGGCGTLTQEVEHVDHDDGWVSNTRVQRLEKSANFFQAAINKYGPIN